MKIKMLSILAVGAVAMLAVAGRVVSQGAQAPSPYATLTGDAAVSADDLRAAIDPLFDRAENPQIGETRALLVLHNGKVIAERYGEGFDADSRHLSWSVAKTVTALLVGIMASDGRLALDDPAPVSAWRQPGDPRAAITLRQLLQMRSGLQHTETRGPLEKTDALAMLVGAGAPDQLAYAESKPLIHKPGTVFNYSSGNSVILAGLVTSQLTELTDPNGRRDAMMQFIQARFSGPLGLKSFAPEFDEKGTLLGGVMIHMTARDYGKVGEFMRLRGRIGDRQLLSDRWIDFMTSPSPANPAYGGQIWLNRAGQDSALFPGEARRSLFGASGYRGQFILVSPEQKLTIVRLGVTNEDNLPVLRHALARLVRVIP
jgi:CubicO group peptidase (beta-lactamase class C family)